MLEEGTTDGTDDTDSHRSAGANASRLNQLKSVVSVGSVVPSSGQTADVQCQPELRPGKARDPVEMRQNSTRIHLAS